MNTREEAETSPYKMLGLQDAIATEKRHLISPALRGLYRSVHEQGVPTASHAGLDLEVLQPLVLADSSISAPHEFHLPTSSGAFAARVFGFFVSQPQTVQQPPRS